MVARYGYKLAIFCEERTMPILMKRTKFLTIYAELQESDCILVPLCE